MPLTRRRSLHPFNRYNTEGHKIGGSTLDILWALTCLGLPMLVLTAIFLGLVYGYEISNGSKASTDLLGRPSSVQDSSAYYVDYSATRLATVSSWTSTVTSFTVTFIMVLVSYPLAKGSSQKVQIRRRRISSHHLPIVFDHWPTPRWIWTSMVVATVLFLEKTSQTDCSPMAGSPECPGRYGLEVRKSTPQPYTSSC